MHTPDINDIVRKYSLGEVYYNSKCTPYLETACSCVKYETRLIVKCFCVVLSFCADAAFCADSAFCANSALFFICANSVFHR